MLVRIIFFPFRKYHQYFRKLVSLYIHFLVLFRVGLFGEKVLAWGISISDWGKWIENSDFLVTILSAKRSRF